MYSFYSDLFSDKRMREVFSERSFVDKLLRFEVALSEAEAELGVIPAEAASVIAAGCHIEHVDFDRLTERTAEVGFPVAPLLEQLSKSVGPEGREFLHWGATTQDAMDTALVLQFVDAFEIISNDLSHLTHDLAVLANRHRSTVMAGRSQMLHASPISFGYKVAVWLDGLLSAETRLTHASEAASQVQLGGAVGTLSALGEENGLAVRAQVAEKLGLRNPAISWHTSRGRITDVVASLGTLTAAMAKIGLDVSLMAQTELGELSVASKPGHGVSSTMPQKRNLIEPQVMEVAAKAVKQYVAVMLDASVQDHERGTGTWQLEWIAVPEAFLLTSGALTAANRMISSLEVNTDRMQENLERSGDLIMAEAFMMKLAPAFGRTQAHEMVSESTDTALATGKSLIKILRDRTEIRELEERNELDLSDVAPMNYLGATSSMIDAVLEREKND